MKILFIGHSYDYLQNDILHGLRGLYGADVIDYPKVDTCYKTYPTEKKAVLHGQGFGIGCTLDDIAIDRENISDKIANQLFDLVVIGQVPNGNNVLDMVQYQTFVTTIAQVLKSYADSPQKIVITDGSDGTSITSSLEGVMYFKRELHTEPNLCLHPITFSFPKEKIYHCTGVDKVRVFANTRPLNLGSGLYNERDMLYVAANGTEKDYYNDYRRSLFGFTLKKAGWDCQRHYEIIFNHSVPYFYDIEKCPPWILSTWPKDLLKEAKELPGVKYPDGTLDEIPKDTLQQYINIEHQLFTHACKMFTTEAVARYVVEVAMN